MLASATLEYSCLVPGAVPVEGAGADDQHLPARAISGAVPSSVDRPEASSGGEHVVVNASVVTRVETPVTAVSTSVVPHAMRPSASSAELRPSLNVRITSRHISYVHQRKKLLERLSSDMSLGNIVKGSNDMSDHDEKSGSTHAGFTADLSPLRVRPVHQDPVPAVPTSPDAAARRLLTRNRSRLSLLRQQLQRLTRQRVFMSRIITTIIICLVGLLIISIFLAVRGFSDTQEDIAIAIICGRAIVLTLLFCVGMACMPDASRSEKVYKRYHRYLQQGRQLL
jgi:hypothetical protein